MLRCGSARLCSVVDRRRPELLHWRLGRDTQAVGLTAIEPVAGLVAVGGELDRADSGDHRIEAATRLVEPVAVLVQLVAAILCLASLGYAAEAVDPGGCSCDRPDGTCPTFLALDCLERYRVGIPTPNMKSRRELKGRRCGHAKMLIAKVKTRLGRPCGRPKRLINESSSR